MSIPSRRKTAIIQGIINLMKAKKKPPLSSDAPVTSHNHAHPPSLDTLVASQDDTSQYLHPSILTNLTPSPSLGHSMQTPKTDLRAPSPSISSLPSNDAQIPQYTTNIRKEISFDALRKHQMALLDSSFASSNHSPDHLLAPTAPRFDPNQRIATVALVGASNAGKSTLMNRLVGKRIAAVSRKMNTTRSRVLGVSTIHLNQLVFYDTPGIVHWQVAKDLNALDRKDLIKAGWDAAAEADVCAFIVDGTVTSDKEDKFSELKDVAIQLNQLLAGQNADSKTDLILVVNKIDLVNKKKKQDLKHIRQKIIDEGKPLVLKDALTKLPLRVDQALMDLAPFSCIFEISALKGKGLNTLKDYLLSKCKPGPWIVDSSQFHAASPEERVYEVVREKAFNILHQEVPYAATFEIEKWAQGKELVKGQAPTLYIHVRIRVANRRHVRMALGSRGEHVKWIKKSAEKDLEDLFGRPVNLYIAVAARKKKAR